MSIQQLMQRQIEEKLSGGLAVAHMEVINESHMHSVPPNSETHFKVILVSPEFADKRPVTRHQMVYRLLADELAGGVHALALHTYTAAEWQQRAGSAPDSPECLGGSKHDHA
jgi:BolA protein